MGFVEILVVEAAIAPRSALIFIIFPTISRITIRKAIFFEYFLDITIVNPLLVIIPILAQIPTITIINGYRNNDNNKRPNPNFAPA